MKKVLIILCVIFILLPIILVLGFAAYLGISKQIDYNKNKKVVYDYISKEYGKEFELIRVEKEDYDFWTSREDTFYFRDKEKDFCFEIVAAHGKIDNDTYNENKLGKDIEKEFYKNLTKDINLDFIFKAESYGFEEERKYSSTYLDLFVFYDSNVNYEEIYKLVSFIKNKYNGINIVLNISPVSDKENYIKILNNEKDYGDFIFMPLLVENISYEKTDSLEKFINFVNSNSRVY